MTNGHLSIIHRGLKTFDGLVVAIANNTKKTPLFSVEERKKMILDAIGHDPRVEVTSFQGLMASSSYRPVWSYPTFASSAATSSSRCPTVRPWSSSMARSSCRNWFSMALKFRRATLRPC